ncbi:MAG: RNA-binding transcriptional accessory protein [bacterium]|nr:RNA-binding transcriptional accessory protein [bacterium]
MSIDHYKKIAAELSINERQVKATAELLDEGGTVPFISRYRKEVTGSLDEVAIAAIRDRLDQLRELDKRKEFVLKTIKDQEKLTPELERAIINAETLTEVEDLYLPYKPKRKTRATQAKEKGLEPLSKVLFEQGNISPESEAEKFIDEEKGVKSIEEALQGARDIIAEQVNENSEVRSKIRDLFSETGHISAKVMPGKEEEGQKFKDYFEWDESVKDIPSHRLLALRRGEKEMILSLDIAPEEEEAIEIINKQFVTGNNDASEQVEIAIKDAYKRLLKPSLETDSRLSTKKKADEEAIKVFAENLGQLLMAAPLGEKRVLALDPGFRTGCKLVVLNEQGKLLDHTAIYPNEPQKRVMESGAVVKQMVDQYNIEAIAIGNGTASRETESFVKSLGLDKEILVVMVNESGASIYSASETARNEFPDHDVTVRGAVSIGRRLADPLAELVKIDAKSIGVGQYQHDVDQNLLKHSLDETVMSCVNKVGVELNTASKELLTYVSGLGPQLAENIVNYRNENGAFKDRNELKKVARLGGKAFEQAAGFIRIRGAKNPLDQSAVHPESYHIVESMAKDLNVELKELVGNPKLKGQIKLDKYVTDTVGLPTLKDIVEELSKPGRDPREKFEAFSFQDGVNEITDLRPGMKLPGIVTNITKFGAFVDIGVHQDGLVHVSEMANRFISDPNEVVEVSQKVEVTVTDIDVARKRISLSMKGEEKAPSRKKPQNKRQDNRRQDNRKQERQPEGDLQAKLAMLKGKFNS